MRMSLYPYLDFSLLGHLGLHGQPELLEAQYVLKILEPSLAVLDLRAQQVDVAEVLE